MTLWSVWSRCRKDFFPFPVPFIPERAKYRFLKQARPRNLGKAVPIISLSPWTSYHRKALVSRPVPVCRENLQMLLRWADSSRERNLAGPQLSAFASGTLYYSKTSVLGPSLAMVLSPWQPVDAHWAIVWSRETISCCPYLSGSEAEHSLEDRPSFLELRGLTYRPSRGRAGAPTLHLPTRSTTPRKALKKSTREDDCVTLSTKTHRESWRKF